MRQVPSAKRTAPFASASWILISAAEGGGGLAVFFGGSVSARCLFCAGERYLQTCLWWDGSVRD